MDAAMTVRRLPKGANVALRELDAELGSVTVLLDSRRTDSSAVEPDVSVLLLDSDGRVRDSDDLVFYNQPIGLGGAVHLRDRVNVASDEGEGVSSDVVTLELDDVPEEITRIVVSASLDPSSGVTFGDAEAVEVRLQRTSDATDLLVLELGEATTETALVFGEFYRRAGEWRIRAVGQGYAGGLEALVSEFGVDVTSEPPEYEASAYSASVADSASLAGTAEATPDTRPDIEQGTGRGAEQDAEPSAVLASPAVSVRRPARAPRYPTDWDRSIPAADGNDWQPARLFPIAGIGSGEEQERRATSALLAVTGGVREFGRALVKRCGAPAGTIAPFIEVPFGQDEEAYRPDGVLRVRRGQTEWTALVEVKTANNHLKLEQIDHYVDIARARGYDAVITISNELTGADVDHPVSVDRRKLRKVALIHLPWDQIRAEALLAVRYRGVADTTQRWVLEEFLHYMNHARSGLQGFTDMGRNWVPVREAVKGRTARSTDKAVADISARFDQLMEHMSFELSGMLGVEVRAQTPRHAPDSASRCQQLADSGALFGSLRVPGAVDLLIISGDVRADRVAISITVQAPRGDTRPLTRVNWLLRQLPETTVDSLRIEALLAGGRGASTVGLLGKLKTEPALLIPADQREIRAFRLSLDASMGSKRAAGSGTLIASVKTLTNTFYADVVQHLRVWQDR